MKRIVLIALAVFAIAALPAFAAPGDQLPDLVMVKPSGNGVRVVNENGRRLLRYDAVVKNIGAGAFELNAGRADVSSPWAVTQRIYDDVGASRTVPTTADVEWSAGDDGHFHYHVIGFETGELFTLAGQSVGELAKHGFCFLDTKGPRNGFTYGSAGCGFGAPEDWLSLRMGLSAGWADEYLWSFPGQYIDITGVSPGRYRLTLCAATSLGFVEASVTNNCVSMSVRV